jgi:hypothetical protein
MAELIDLYQNSGYRDDIRPISGQTHVLLYQEREGMYPRTFYGSKEEVDQEVDRFRKKGHIYVFEYTHAEPTKVCPISITVAVIDQSYVKIPRAKKKGDEDERDE